jgi:UDPglucose 6-dehydrogenase
MHGVNVGLLEAVEQVNMQRIERFIERLVARMWLLRSKTVGVLGLAFKPGTDDVRGAQSLEVVRRLLSEGAFVKAFDPEANDNARALLPEQAGSLKYVASPYEAAEGADALAVLTEWPAFKALDLSRLRACMRVPLLADGRNLYEPATVRAAGFEYFSIGRR